MKKEKRAGGANKATLAGYSSTVKRLMSSCQPPQQPPLLPLFVLVGFSRAHLCSIECGVFTVQLNLLLPRALEAGTVCGNKCCSLAFLWRSSRLCIFHLSSLRCRIIETSPLRVLYSRTPSCVSSAVEKSESAYIGHNQERSRSTLMRTVHPSFT